jgi:F-type H+-transporting ATPase subunit a
MIRKNSSPLIVVFVLLLSLACLPWSAAQEHGAVHTATEAVTGHSTPAENGHTEAAVAPGEHAAGEHAVHHEKHPPEPPDLLLILMDYLSGPAYEFVRIIRVPLYSILIAVLILLWFRKTALNLQKIPSRRQCLAEICIETLDDFVCSILGKEIGRKYLPLLGTAAIYIWIMNLAVLVPGAMSPTAIVFQTFALSLTIFVTVQFTAIRYLGIGGYLFHLANEPRDLIGYILAPLFFPIHVMGELIKPVSLGLRLWGNVLGEGILMGVFSALGLMLMPALASLVGWNFEHAWIGIPFNFPLMLLVLLGSTIQAMVFLSLSTIYISLVLPHHEHEEHHAHEGAH